MLLTSNLRNSRTRGGEEGRGWGGGGGGGGGGRAANWHSRTQCPLSETSFLPASLSCIRAIAPGGVRWERGRGGEGGRE